MGLAQAYEKKFQKSLNAEREKRRRLEETVETLAKQHNKLEQVCKIVDIRSMSLISLQNHQNVQNQKSPGGTIEHEDDDEDDHDEFFDAMSEHPEAFGIKNESETNSFIDQSGSDPYSDIDESSDSMSMISSSGYEPVKIETADASKVLKSELRRSASEQQLENSHPQELGHRRAVSYDLLGQMAVSRSIFISKFYSLNSLGYYEQNVFY